MGVLDSEGKGERWHNFLTRILSNCGFPLVMRGGEKGGRGSVVCDGDGSVCAGVLG